MSNKLKSCPFCGETDIKIKLGFFPSCTRCGAVQDNVAANVAKSSWNARYEEDDEKQRASYYQGELYKATEQLSSAKAEIAAYEKAIAWHVNHTNEMHKEIVEYRKCLGEIKDINAPAEYFSDTEWYALVGIHDLLAKHKGE